MWAAREQPVDYSLEVVEFRTEFINLEKDIKYFRLRFNDNKKHISNKT